jgi:hypothetical protein
MECTPTHSLDTLSEIHRKKLVLRAERKGDDTGKPLSR